MLASALTCQYNEKTLISEETAMAPFYLNGTQLEFLIVKFEDLPTTPILLQNPNSVPINIIFSVSVATPDFNCPDYGLQTYNLTIPASGEYEVKWQFSKWPNEFYCKNLHFTSPYKITYYSSDRVEVKLTTIRNYSEKCLGFDDDAICQTNDQCGSKLCLQSKCANQTAVLEYNKQQEYPGMTLLGVIVLFIILGLGLRLTRWVKRQVKTKKEQRKPHDGSIDENTFELINEREKRTKEIDSALLTPHYDPQANGRQVVISPINGYKYFYNKNKPNAPIDEPDRNLVHVWVWEKANKKKKRYGYEIHHKDFNKLNNAPENLEELSPEEHKKRHHDRYIH